MLLSQDEILELFAATGGEDVSAASELEISTIRVADGLLICAVADGLPDGKRSGRLSEFTSDKLSIRLSNFLTLVRYYFVLNFLRFHAQLTKVAKSFKRPLRNFSNFGRFLAVLCLSPARSCVSVLSCRIWLILVVLLTVSVIVNFVLVIEYW